MKLVLTVLTIRLIMELVTKKRSGKSKITSETNSGKVQHPAAYELR